jgi:hypothetical protein
MDPVPPAMHFAPMLEERRQLWERLVEVEATNRELQRRLNRGAVAEFFHSPGGIAALIVTVLLGAAVGAYSGTLDEKSGSFVNGAF